MTTNSPHTTKACRVAMAVTTDYLSDPRVLRSSRTLAEEGYDVRVFAREKRGTHPFLQQGCCLGRVEKNSVEGVGSGVAVTWLKPWAQRSVFFYAEFNMRLFLRLLREQVDVIYANDTDTLPACYWAARLRGKSLVFDAHELFPEVPELVDRPRVKHFWDRIESYILPRLPKLKAGWAAVTVCQSITDYYHRRYGLAMSVVRNLPDDSLTMEQDPGASLSSDVLLYEGAVNKGRGVRQMMDAMQHLPEYRLVVAGDGDELSTLTRYRTTLPWKERIELLGHRSPGELARIASKAALGLVLLEPLGLSYYYSLPNRVALFAHAGVPILASDFPEIARVVKAYGMGHLVDCSQGIPEGNLLADEVRKALAEWRTKEAAARKESILRAQEDLSWSHDRPILLAALRKSLTPKL